MGNLKTLHCPNKQTHHSNAGILQLFGNLGKTGTFLHIMY
jgi:hypothetical protein